MIGIWPENGSGGETTPCFEAALEHAKIFFIRDVCRFPCNILKRCQVMCGQRSLEAEVGLRMIKHGRVLSESSGFFLCVRELQLLSVVLEGTVTA